MILGLRIDVDTLRGTKVGVPNLCRMLKTHGIHASFFLSVGPDNMGRHIWRLIRPKFFIKMLCSKAASLYGWDILLRGTFGEGPIIGSQCADVIKNAADDGHEIGLHAWDHYSWQTHIDTMSQEEIDRTLKQGFEFLKKIIGRPPACSAVPAWKCNDMVLGSKEEFPFRYNSDVRGKSIFYPIINGRVLTQPQIPVTLPTYDEVAGQRDFSAETYNDHILSLVKPDRLNVLTIHAEVEGICCLKVFEDFLVKAKNRGVQIVPLGSLLNESWGGQKAAVVKGSIQGREGWGSFQDEESIS